MTTINYSDMPFVYKKFKDLLLSFREMMKELTEGVDNDTETKECFGSIIKEAEEYIPWCNYDNIENAPTNAIAGLVYMAELVGQQEDGNGNILLSASDLLVTLSFTTSIGEILGKRALKTNDISENVNKIDDISDKLDNILDVINKKFKISHQNSENNTSRLVNLINDLSYDVNHL